MCRTLRPMRPLSFLDCVASSSSSSQPGTLARDWSPPLGACTPTLPPRPAYSAQWNGRASQTTGPWPSAGAGWHTQREGEGHMHGVAARRLHRSLCHRCLWPPREHYACAHTSLHHLYCSRRYCVGWICIFLSALLTMRPAPAQRLCSSWAGLGAGLPLPPASEPD